MALLVLLKVSFQFGADHDAGGVKQVVHHWLENIHGLAVVSGELLVDVRFLRPEILGHICVHKQIRIDDDPKRDEAIRHIMARSGVGDGDLLL